MKQHKMDKACSFYNWIYSWKPGELAALLVGNQSQVAAMVTLIIVYHVATMTYTVHR